MASDPFPLSIRPTSIVTPVIDEHGSAMLCRVWYGIDSAGNKVQCLIAAVGFEGGANHEQIARHLIEVDNPGGQRRTF